MTKFLLKTFFVLTILLFGVVFGIHQANEGTLSLFGKKEAEQTVTAPSSPPVEKQKVKDEKQTVPPVEKEQPKEEERVKTTQQLQEKQQLAADVGAFNFYSELGSNIGELLEILVYHTVSAITGIIHGWLNN
ncbi:DUF3679 domain-containing protein [Alkalihalobacterium chitinilyticum]|uniref:DUF3679 domain-containing protein n=1 Tax=Alkalihalobacterium chitinilyticum TaxID=2980103 RepID=A0ABT5VEH1_9BACI|nr:DUF3679 domain-containing protein [Alkalihalobacterium chitinilyticum]MDE5413858.1 DUF3679 domain-containing protein [Alkalihalobacterium chitinilyticum]